MKALWRSVCVWLSVQASVALICSIVFVQGASAQVADQTLDLSGQSGDVTIESGGTWLISGSLSGGLTIDIGDDAIVLVLDGVEITNNDGPAIAFVRSGDVTIETTSGSVNFLADGGSNEMDAAIWAEANLTFAGDGTLDITAVAEGIETTADITVESGTILIHSGEDGMNANTDGVSQIVINGGTLVVTAVAGDGIDSNGSVEINGGIVVSYGSLVDANSGLDADGPVVIHGGTVVASGGPMMQIDLSSSQTQIWTSFDGTLAAGSGVVVMNGDDVVVAVQPLVDVQSLFISAPGLDGAGNNQLMLDGTFTVDETSLASDTIQNVGTAGGTISDTNPMGAPGRP